MQRIDCGGKFTYVFTPYAQPVAEVNGSFAEDADRLTDEVYHFDTKDRVFEKVDKFVARQKENSQKHVAEKGTEGIQKPKKSHEMSL